MTVSHEQSEAIKIAAVLQQGGVIAIPTDTLYALAADARSDAAIERVFAIKGREPGKALPLFVSDATMASRIAVVSAMAERLMRRFWPGALTLVLAKQPGFESQALSGGNTVALRAPGHALMLAVVQALGTPVTATSANRSGGPDPVSADEVRRQLADELDLIVDAGECAVGISSTIVDCTGGEPRILRHGAIAEADILQALQPASRAG